MTPTPKELGYRMPAEWEKHSAVWLAWPYDPITFPDRVNIVEKKFAEIINILKESEPVNLLVRDDKMKKRAEKFVPGVSFFIKDYADVWVRDYAPSFLSAGKKVKWKYDAYSRKFPALEKDNEVFAEADFRPDMVLEGGAVETDGRWVILATKQCLLDSGRNPSLTREMIEDYLKEYLGADRIVWLEEGIVNDHTDGHIDDVAKFVKEKTVVCGWEDDPKDPNFRLLKNAHKTLAAAGLEVLKLPMPHLRYDFGAKAPASYANFYIGNKTVLVPTFRDPNDQEALALIRSLFPGRDTVGIDCVDILYGGGAIHCITREVPA